MIAVEARSSGHLPTIAAMARCSKAMHALVVPVLYRKLAINPTNCFRIFSTLKKQSKGQSVFQSNDPWCKYKLACFKLVKSATVTGNLGLFKRYYLLRLSEGRSKKPNPSFFPNVERLRLNEVPLCCHNATLRRLFDNPRHVCVTGKLMCYPCLPCDAIYCQCRTYLRLLPTYFQELSSNWSVDTLTFHGYYNMFIVYPQGVAVRAFPLVPPTMSDRYVERLVPPRMDHHDIDLRRPRSVELIGTPPPSSNVIDTLNNRWQEFIKVKVKNDGRDYTLPPITWTPTADALPCIVCGWK